MPSWNCETIANGCVRSVSEKDFWTCLGRTAKRVQTLGCPRCLVIQRHFVPDVMALAICGHVGPSRRRLLFWPTMTCLSEPRRRAVMAFNLVEALQNEDSDCAFDQPCKFGHRVDEHAVYCHNDAWPDGPRKCRRTWYTGGEVKEEDCPGFQPNPDYVKAG